MILLEPHTHTTCLLGSIPLGVAPPSIMSMLALTYQDGRVPLAHSHSRLPRTLTCWTAWQLLALCLCTLMPTKKACRPPPSTPHMLTLQEPTQPLHMPWAGLCSPLQPHPDSHLPPQFLELTPPSCNLLSSLYIFLNARSSTYTHIHTPQHIQTWTHTCSHPTITPQSLDPQLPQLRAARPAGPGDSWWEKMSSGCSDGRSHTGM